MLYNDIVGKSLEQETDFDNHKTCSTTIRTGEIDSALVVGDVETLNTGDSPFNINRSGTCQAKSSGD